MLVLNVNEEEYNSMLHDLLKLSLILVQLHRSGDGEALQNGLRLLGDVRERMLEIIANND